MSRNKSIKKEVSWQMVENTVSDRMPSNSLNNDFQVKSRMKKRTKIVNSTLRRYSSLNSYSQYLNIKRSLLKKISVDEESDCEASVKSKILSSSYRNLDRSHASTDEESEGDYCQHDDVFIGVNPKLSLSEREDENSSWKNKPSKTLTKNKSSSIKAVRDKTKPTNVLNKKNVSNFKENHAEEDKNQIEDIKEKELSDSVEFPARVTRFSLRRVSTSLPRSSNKISVQNRDAKTAKTRNKTRDDVKKNLSALIGDSDKSELNEARHSDLNLSNMVALAQSTQYPNDSSDMSDKPEKKSLIGDFLTTENKNRPKDSVIEEDSTEEPAKLKGKYINIIENKKSPLKEKQECKSKNVSKNISHIGNSSDKDETLCPEIEDSSENRNVREDETLKNNENAQEQTDDLEKDKHPLKIIASEIVNQKYKIVMKEQEDPTEIHGEESNDEQIDVVGLENCDQSESLNSKLEESEENYEEREEKQEEKSKQRITKKNGHGKKSNTQKGEKEKESEGEIENETEESDEGLVKIKKPIVKKSIDKKLLEQEKHQKQKVKTKKQSIKELKKREDSSEGKSDKENKKAKKIKKGKQRKEKKPRYDLEKLLYSSSESEFEEQNKGKESPNKNQEKDKVIEKRNIETKEEKLSDSAEDSKSGEDEKRIKIQQQKNTIIERRKVEEKEENSSREKGSESEEDEIRTEIQQQNNNRTTPRRKVEDKEEESSAQDSESDEVEIRTEIHQQNNRTTLRRKVEDKEEKSSEQDSESDEVEKRIKIQQQKNTIIKRRKVEDKEEKSRREEDSESEEVEIRTEIQQQNNRITVRRQVEDTEEKSRRKEDSEGEEVEIRTEIQQQNNRITVRRKVEDKEEKSGREEDSESEEVEIRTEIQQQNNRIIVRKQVENKEEKSRREEDSEGEEDKKTTEVQQIKNTVENSESFNLEKLETENEDSDEEGPLRQVLTQVVDREIESEEENQNAEVFKFAVECEENYINLDDNKITIEEHKIEIPEYHNAEKDVEEEKEEVMSAESVKKLQQIKKLNFTLGSDSSSSDEEFSQAQKNRFENLIRREEFDSSDSESEEDVIKKSPKKKKDLHAISPKEKKISEDVGESPNESKEDEKEKIEEVDQGGESDAAFDNCIQEGISFLENKKHKGLQSSSQIIEDIETQHLESSQVISDTDSQICLENEKNVSKKDKEKKIQAECLNYVLSSSKRKNKVFDKEIEHQMVLEEIQSSNNNDNATSKDWKKITELNELVQKENLIEQNYSFTTNLQDISDSEEVWMIQIPKKEISTNLVGKKFSYNGGKLELGETSYKASEKRLHSLTCVLNSPKSKKPYKTVNIRPVACLTVGPKQVLNTSPAENRTEKKKRKSSNVQDSLVNGSTEEVHAETDISRKHKKKKLFNKDSVLAPKDHKSPNHKLGDNEIESSPVVESVSAGSKRKQNHSLSESEEEQKVKPKVDIKRQKKWDNNEYALDEKPPINPPENLSVKKDKNVKQIESHSSDIELWDMKRKPKKEKQKKEQLNQLDITKPAKTPFTKEEKYNSLDVSKVKVKKNNEHSDTDSSLITERVKNDKHKKKKKLVNCQIEKVPESEVEEKLQTKIDIKPEEKKKKKSKRDSEKLNNLSTENKIDKTTEEDNLKNRKISKTSHKCKEETLDGQDFSSDFEVEDERKSKKKLEKKSCFQNIFNREVVKNQEKVKPENEKTKKKIQRFIDFEH